MKAAQNEKKEKLVQAEAKAAHLFTTIESRGLIQSGKSERALNREIFDLAFELFQIKKYWHKRIVRAGRNTLFPYKENPPDLILQPDDILFFDFGPVFEDWEADFGRTYVIGDDPLKIKLKKDVESAYYDGRAYFQEHQASLTGADLYAFTRELAASYGWSFGNVHAGHLIGNFPHETVLGEERINYIHPENNLLMLDKDKFGDERFWIYEVHFVDEKAGIGGFFEQLLS